MLLEIEYFAILLIEYFMAFVYDCKRRGGVAIIKISEKKLYYIDF